MSAEKKIFAWGDSRRYNAYANRVKEKYGGRVQKVSVNAGFTCPNRDGKTGTGGCAYCYNDSFIPFYCVGNKNISEQIDQGISFLSGRYKRVQKYIAYFQAYTNTYAPPDHLRNLYMQALSHPAISGLSISTRPDCLDEEILDYLAHLNRDKIIYIEIGVESCYNHTLERVNRGHTFEQTEKSLRLAHERSLPVTGHILFGLPGESRQEMLEESAILSSLPLHALKFHQLQIIENTLIAQQYKEHPFDFICFTPGEYIQFMVEFLERLTPKISIDRMVAESPSRFKMLNKWNIRIDRLNKKIESVMDNLGTWQGKKFNK